MGLKPEVQAELVRRVGVITERMRQGLSRAEIERQYAPDAWIAEHGAYINDLYGAIIGKAEKTAAKLGPLPPDPVDADASAAMLARLAELEANDTPDRTSAERLCELADKVRQRVSQAVLLAYNKSLAVKSGSLTYEDIAFIAIIHRLSVTENGNAHEHFAATSPFDRICEASVKFGYRDKPFDNRQVRYALTILQEIGFTKETVKGVRGKHAGKWVMLDDPFWAE